MRGDAPTRFIVVLDQTTSRDWLVQKARLESVYSIAVGALAIGVPLVVVASGIERGGAAVFTADDAGYALDMVHALYPAGQEVLWSFSKCSDGTYEAFRTALVASDQECREVNPLELLPAEGRA